MVACRMNPISDLHVPVMLNEVIENMAIKADGIYVDATFGRGGHAAAIINLLGPKGRLIAFDKDPRAVAIARERYENDKRFVVQHDSFANLQKWLAEFNFFGKVDAILFDLGVSSPQLDNAERGFSFMREGALDMRMNTEVGMDAATWVASVEEEELIRVLFEYGEERYSRRIARRIVEARNEAPIKTTTQLAEIISAAIPRWEKGKHPATRSFLAIRIAINHELDDLHRGLAQGLESLRIGGRLVAISFHSLEDRIVKRFVQEHVRGRDFPRGLPITQDQIQVRLKKIGAAIKASEAEISVNPRARSAVLRIAEKLS
jgi:16S rRNA (cytosine1402-N4)-methyltransferase